MNQLVDWQIDEAQMKSVVDAADAYGAAGVEQEPGEHALIWPYTVGQLQPASYDLRLGRELRNEHGMAYDMQLPPRDGQDWSKRRPANRYLEDFEPGRFLLGHTEEVVRMPPHLCGRVEGKSSIGRQGLAVHVTAGFIDPGFRGQITLELKYHGTMRHIKIWPGMLIAQITFHVLAARPRRLYGHPDLGSHYQNQRGATPPAK